MTVVVSVAMLVLALPQAVRADEPENDNLPTTTVMVDGEPVTLVVVSKSEGSLVLGLKEGVDSDPDFPVKLAAAVKESLLPDRSDVSRRIINLWAVEAENTPYGELGVVLDTDVLCEWGYSIDALLDGVGEAWLQSSTVGGR